MARCTAPVYGHRTASGAAACPACSKKQPSFRLDEFLFDSTTAVVRGEEGVFTNEFIFAFHRGNL